MENLKIQIRRAKVDCVFGKKKHFNAADRQQQCHYWLGVPLVLINIITGTTLFIVLTEDANNWVKYVPVTFAFIAAVLSGLQTYFNFSKKVEGHRRCGNDYLAAMKRCKRLEALIEDNIVDAQQATTLFEDISQEIDRINKAAESFPTSKSDYEKAKVGIETGEENYTNKELEL